MVLFWVNRENSHLILLIIFVAGSFQIGLLIWQKKNPRSYLAATFIGLWLLPFFLSLWLGFVRFIILWILFSALNVWILLKATKRHLSPKTPRRVYQFYRRIFQASFVSGLFGYGLFMFWLVFSDSTELASFSTLLMFYSLYAGVLSRDLIDLLSDRMAAVFGVLN